jgi:hypothetical protein
MATYVIEKHGIFTKCCACERIKVTDETGNISFEKREIGDKKVTYTYCPDCAKDAIETFRIGLKQNSILKGKKPSLIGRFQKGLNKICK